MDRFDEQVWKVAVEISGSERHFNQLQHQYRLLASTWTLALFAGLQFLLSQWGDLPLPAPMLLLALGITGALGITLLWNLDIRVYHQLLDACFVEGLRLERTHVWLPQLRTRMLSTQDARRGVLARSVWFYVSANALALLMAGAGAMLWVRDYLLLGTAGQILALILALGVGIAWSLLLSRGTCSPALEAWMRD